MADHVRFFRVRKVDIGMLVEVIMQRARPALLRPGEDEVQALYLSSLRFRHDLPAHTTISPSLNAAQEQGGESEFILRARIARCCVPPSPAAEAICHGFAA